MTAERILLVLGIVLTSSLIIQQDISRLNARRVLDDQATGEVSAKPLGALRTLGNRSPDLTRHTFPTRAERSHQITRPLPELCD